MSSDPKKILPRLSSITDSIKTVFSNDPQLLFSDSFERILILLNETSDNILAECTSEKDYWLMYNTVIALLPFFERLIFCGYSDQILEYLLTLNNKLATNFLFCTSRFVPFRLQLFTTICSAYSNTEESHEKDAVTFIQSFKDEIDLLKQLEESNVNGLTEKITLCTNQMVKLTEVFETAYLTIELMTVHFSNSVDFKYDFNNKNKPPANKGKNAKHQKENEETEKPPVPIPELRTVNLVINAFNSPLPKGQYNSRYSHIIQAWTNPECSILPSFLYRLIFSFLKAGALDNLNALSETLPNDNVIKLAIAISTEKWQEVSDILFELSEEDMSNDYQFFNEIAFKLWKRFSCGQIKDPSILKGVIHVFVNCPSSCPLITSIAALTYCWHLDSLGQHQDAMIASESTLRLVESYRDIFVKRKSTRVFPSSSKVPNKPHDQNYLNFEKWIECMHTDLLTIWIRSKLKYGLQGDVEIAKKQYDEEIDATMKEYIKTKKLNGMHLSQKQQHTFDSLLEKPFKPPNHSDFSEKELLTIFKSNNAAKALLYIQMAFFRPTRASSFLEKARRCMNELESQKHQLNSPVLYANRHEVCLVFTQNIIDASSVVCFGKEIVGSMGLTPQNTALNGTGVKQDQVDPFIITKLKPNTSYSFGFGAYDSQNELIDTITEPFAVTTCHTLSNEIIWSYIASASFQLGDMASFDVSLTYLLDRFTEVSEITPDHQYHQHTNPFNRFLVKPETFNEPAPMLMPFSTALLMAARLFSSKPMHATSFQKIALILMTSLQNHEYILKICNEMFAVVQPLLVNAFHTRWVIHPLIFIIDALNSNKETIKNELHQSLISKCGYALDSILVKVFQEQQLALHTAKCVTSQQPSEYRIEYTLFAASQHLLEAKINDNSSLLANAAEMFRNSPERCFDELFNKHKTDPLFPAAAVYLVSAAHNIGFTTQAIKWCNTALDHIKTHLKAEEEKLIIKKSDSRSTSKLTEKAKPVKKPVKSKKNEPPPPTEEELAQINLTKKFKDYVLRHLQRQRNIQLFKEVNKYRAALNLLLAVCHIESDQQMKAAMESADSVKIAPPDDRRSGQKSRSRQSREQKAASIFKTESEVMKEDNRPNTNVIITSLMRAIILADRANDQIIIRSALIYCQLYISTTFKESLAEYHTSFSSYITASSLALIQCIDFTNDISNERWTVKLLQEFLVLLLSDGQIEHVKLILSEACKRSPLCNTLLWLIDNYEENSTKSLISQTNELSQIEKKYYITDGILKRAVRPSLYPRDNSNSNYLIQLINKVSISLQQKHKVSMSISLLSKLSYLLISRGEVREAVSKLCEVLECHLRQVRSHEKIDQILKDETEESFYQKHSWSGCLSIAVISSLLSIFTGDSSRQQSIMLMKLASFSISALFSNSIDNPKKQSDYADFEPSEIVPGKDIFSDFDPKQPLLEAPPAEIVSIALANILSSMLSYELYYEMYKPLALAKHFFRYIIREKRSLARTRLISVIVCSHFGFMRSAMNTLNDVLTSYGESRITKESALYTNDQSSKRFLFDSNEAANSSVNIEAAKTISSATSVEYVTNNYGFSNGCLYVIAASRALLCLAASSDPTFTYSSGAGVSRGTARGTKKGNRSHQGSKRDNDQSGPTVDSFDICTKAADQLVSGMLSKDFNADQLLIKLELTLEQANIYMNVWRWEDAVELAQNILKERPVNPTISTSFINRPAQLATGLIFTSRKIIAEASYNLNDFQSAEKFASPYIKSLIMIRKADSEGAALLLTKVVFSKIMTAFYKEQVLATAQFITLLNSNPKLVDTIKEKVGQNERKLLNPIEMVTNLVSHTFSFYSEQLKLNEENTYYIRDTQLLVRLKHLEAITNLTFNGPTSPLETLAEAQALMSNRCPYVWHGLTFLLNATCSRVQMQSFIQSTPSLVQQWNQEISPLSGIEIAASHEFVEKITLLLHTMFSQAPDCVVHPASQQCILDLAILAGISSPDDNSSPLSTQKRLEHSLATLTVAHAVRNSRRFVQSIISSCPDSPPQPNQCPLLIFNEHKGQKLRGIAAAYYSHVCTLDLPLFDADILELRTLLFFKCFEELCAPFKSLQTATEAQSALNLETDQIVGQWYQVDAKIFKSDTIQDNATTTVVGTTRSSAYTAFTSATGRSNVTSSTSASGRSRSAVLKGSLYFFIGIVVGYEEPPKKINAAATSKATKKVDNNNQNNVPGINLSDSPNRLTPILLAAQMNDLRSTSNEMAEIGLEIEEAARMETADDTAPPPKPDASASASPRRRAPSSGKGKGKIEAPQPVSLLKNQADAAKKNAEIKWGVTLHKAETVFNKSNRIFGYLVENKNRWPNEVKMTGIDISSAASLSHFFNTQFGINEKSPQLAAWLVSTAGGTIEPPPPPSA